jgi:hypothetical protein
MNATARKIGAVIQSCRNSKQLENARKMIALYTVQVERNHELDFTAKLTDQADTKEMLIRHKQAEAIRRNVES